MPFFSKSTAFLCGLQTRLLQGGKYPIHVYLYWGVDPHLTAETETGWLGLSPPDSERGYAVWDDNVELTSTKAQQSIVDMCDALLSNQLMVRHCLSI